MGTGDDPLDLEVPPAPVRDPRGGGRAGLTALVGIVAVIIAAIGSAQLVPQAPAPPRVSFALPTSGPTAAALPSSSPSPAPDPSSILADTPPRLSREDLRAAVLDGSLDGRLVFVEGVMRATSLRCQGRTKDSRDCVELEIPGIGLPVRLGEAGVPVQPGESDTPWPGEPPPGAWLVTVARDGGLVYLGSLVPSGDGAQTIDEIVEGFGPRGRDWTDGTLFEVDGFLLAPPAEDGEPWRVVVRYEPSRAVRVIVP